MRDQLLEWQWAHYPEGHTTRLNLIVHAITVPMFQGGFLILLTAPILGWPALFGLLAMVTAIIGQGRGHGHEPTKPIPFQGPFDVVSRLFVEQWVTFPRFMLSGGFVRAWMRSGKAR